MCMTEVTCFAANTSFKFILGAVYIHPGASMQDIGMLLWQGLGPYIHNSQYVPPFVQVDSSIPILLCAPPQTTAISADRCSLSHEVGNCFDYTERWFYDHQYGQCRSFRYSGCGGNANNFASLDQCREACSRGAPLTTTPATLTSSLGLPSFTVESCFLDHATGPCTQNELHWYYDKADGVCKEFYYGGCEGNDNRFVTRRECESRCGRAQDLCTLPKAKGSCRGSFTQFFYDFYADECREFEFSGCQGNANRFDNRELCEQSCRQRRTTTTSVAPPLEEETYLHRVADTCLQPYDPGSCHDLHTQWYYDSLDNLCKSFVYTGCGGNSNRFTSRRECQASCMRKATQEPGPPPGPPPPPRDPNAEVCRLPAEPGPCDQPQPRFFYDPSTQSCLTFTYSGCGGNKNRFKAIDTCQRFCSNVMRELLLSLFI
ncbi:PAPLN [Cordylochernes scorpioides]|uniref:PAPLN n=1 Tax=Cordylochernes scorpioides TaxID=51811 RepID=A0ABY6KC19_9ARAC|nr:PAPLN [Cordylochernes scorpioides]